MTRSPPLDDHAGVALPAVPLRDEVAERLTRLLIDQNLLPPEKIEEIQHRSHWLGEPPDQILIRENLLPQETLRDLLSKISGIPVASLMNTQLNAAVLARVPITAVNRFQVMPIQEEYGSLCLACARIPDPAEADQIRVLIGQPLRWFLCTQRELQECIKHYYGVGLESFLSYIEERGPDVADGKAPRQPDITRFIHQILEDAIRGRATDVHIEPTEHAIQARYRIDGVLYPIPLPVGIAQFRRAVVSCIKIMAQMNIAERRLPQDGRFSLCPTPEGDTIDIRVSVLPSRFGEAVNMRILNRQSTFLKLDDLNMSAAQRESLDDLIAFPHGIILFTGPTGSGKTTSLYAAIARLNNHERKIITIEDPIEYEIEGTLQMQVQPEIGFSFPIGLRAILRHDPDVILIGEIRDTETAGIAVSAALTGHLVFSTLHTNDAPSALPRLIDLGAEPYLVASSVQGVVAQRLMRCICTACRESYEENAQVLLEARTLFPDLPESTPFFRGRGCPACRFLGYDGRRGIFEILTMTDVMRRLVLERTPSERLMGQALREGLTPLRHQAWEYAIQGVATVGDVMRLTRRSHTDRT